MTEPKPAASLAENVSDSVQAAVTVSRAQGSIETSLSDSPAKVPAPVANPAGSPLPESFGRYKIVKELGKGAMGVVYLADDTQLDRQVALKIPKKAVLEEPDALERFYREAKTTSKLRHPNICPMFDVGAIDGTHYLTMAYIPGKPISDFLKKGKVPAAKSVALLIRKIALALDEAHRLGVVHRDLKPANVMFDDRNEPIVMDFGLACQTNTAEQARLTQSGAILGTPAYMAPEQVRSEAQEIGPQSDVYALGVMMYQFLTGELPFTGPIMTVFAQILRDQPKRPSSLRPDVDPALETICLKMMAKEKSQRYGSMKEAAAALAGYLKTAGEAPSGTGEMKLAEETAKSAIAQPGAPTPPVVAKSQPKAAPATKKAANLSPEQLKDLTELVDQLLIRNDHPEAIRIIEELPDYQRTARLKSQLGEAYQALATVEKLERNLEKLLNLTDIPALKKCVDQLLKLRPSHPRGKEIRKALNTEGKQGVVKLLKKEGNYHGGGLAWETWQIGAAAGCVALIFGVMSFAIFIYLKNPQQTVAIEIDDPTAVVKIDGNAATINADGVGEIRLSLGNHTYTVEQGATTVVTDGKYEVKRDGKNVLRITLNKTKPDDSVAGTASSGKALATRNMSFPVALRPGDMWWSFNRTDRQRVPDQGGSGVDAFALGHAFVPGKVGNALKLDDNGFVDTGFKGAFGKDKPFSASAWVYVTNNKPMAIISTMEGNDHGIELHVMDDIFAVLLCDTWNDGNAIAVQAAQPPKFFEWTHVAFSYDGSGKAGGVKLYINGKPQETRAATDHLVGDCRTDRSILIGARRGNGILHSGMLDEVRIYQKILTGQEVTALAQSDQPQKFPNDGLIAAWTFDTDERTSVKNSVQPTNSGTVKYTAALPEKRGNIVDFTGRGTWEVTGNTGDFGTSTAFSIGCWYQKSASGEGTLISKFTGSQPSSGYVLDNQNGKLTVTIASDWPSNEKARAIVVGQQGSVPPDIWQHIIVTYDGSSKAAGVKLYVNGASVPVNSYRDDLDGSIHTKAPLRFGSRTGAGYLSGGLSEVFVFPRLLTPQDAQQLYEQSPKPDPNAAASMLVQPELSGNAPPPAVGPFESAQAKAHQEAWAKYLNQNVTVKNSVGMDLVLIPAGEFLMGSPASDAAAGDREKPQQQVKIGQPFYLGTKEVTQGEWQAVMGTTPWKGQPNIQEGANYPATFVSWNDAQDFCRKLSQQEGATYRLPTEAEWEYACRGGQTTKFHFGDNESSLENYGWYKKNAFEIGEKYGHQVGLKQANPFGLHDMHGNVWELCEDMLVDKLAGGTDPLVSTGGEFLVHRGGSWNYEANQCRSAFRHGIVPDSRGDDLGFRVVRQAMKGAEPAQPKPGA